MTSTQTTIRVTGRRAIELAERDPSVVLCTYSDPTEEGREGVSVSEAQDIASEDPRLVYADVEVTEYVVLQAIDAWGELPSRITAEEHEAACERMEAWLTDHEGDEVDIYVRPTRRNEAEGTYERATDGTLHTAHDVPEEVRELIGSAWQHACETWPAESADDLVVVEVMPESLRASHDAAGGRGIYPHNGARRALLLRTTADAEIDDDDEWIRVILGAARDGLEIVESIEALL